MSDDGGPLFVYEKPDITMPRKLITGTCEPFADNRRQHVKHYHIIQVSKQQLLVTYDAHKVRHHDLKSMIISLSAGMYYTCHSHLFGSI
jgi:hypothetical protein